jgi:hypothetical protein
MGNIRAECGYCGSTDRITRDHVPPKGLFPAPRTPDLVTVPACEACNQGFKRDDEYFVTSLELGDAVRKTREGKQLAEKVLRSLQRPAATGFATMVAAQIQLSDIAAPQLDLPRGMHGFVLDAVRLRKTAERITKGLLFHTTGRRLPETHEVRALLLGDLPSLVEKLYLSQLAHTAPVEIASGRFAFSTMWLLDFYAETNFLVITASRPRQAT